MIRAQDKWSIVLSTIVPSSDEASLYNTLALFTVLCKKLINKVGTQGMTVNKLDELAFSEMMKLVEE